MGTGRGNHTPKGKTHAQPPAVPVLMSPLQRAGPAESKAHKGPSFYMITQTQRRNKTSSENPEYCTSSSILPITQSTVCCRAILSALARTTESGWRKFAPT